MAITKFLDVCLYTTDLINPVECHAAKAWLDHSEIKFNHLRYNDANQLPQVMEALNTWWSGKVLGGWPFVVYRYEDDQKNGLIVSDFIEGLDNIKQQLPEILASSKTPWV